MLEAAQYEDNTFATLTYSDEKLPQDNSVNPRELQLFFKKLRNYSALKLRYFACGEYGDVTGRPHYHAAIFGYPSCRYAVTRPDKYSGYCCAQCEAIKTAWGKGLISLGQLEQKSAAYIAGYVTKKMTNIDDPRLEGRLPEFARMSLRPGIGLGMMHELASTLMEHKIDDKYIDVPLALDHGKKRYPLGRYLRRKLRAFIGKEEKCPDEIIEEIQKELLPMRETAFVNSRSFAKEIANAGAQRRLQLETQEKIFKSRKPL